MDEIRSEKITNLKNNQLAATLIISPFQHHYHAPLENDNNSFKMAAMLPILEMLQH